MNRRLAALLPLLLAACGGGDGDDVAPCTIPGTLRALAVEGQAAAGIPGAVYGPFAPGTILDTAAGGWSVFVGPTDDPVRTSAMWVALPDGTVLLVFAVGDVVPDAGGGTISGFVDGGCEVDGAGHMVAQVTVTGDAGGRTFGLLTARVDAGAVVDRHDVVYHTANMAGSGVAGTLTSLDPDHTHLAEGGAVFFGGGTSAGAVALWRANADGSGLAKMVASGDALGGRTLVDLQVTGIDPAGTLFAFAGDGAPGAQEGVYTGVPGGASFSRLALDGDALSAASGGGTIAEAYTTGPLVVYAGGAVVWQGEGSGPGNDDVALIGRAATPFSVLARTDAEAPGTGGGTYGGLGILEAAPGCAAPLFTTTLAGVAPANDFTIFGLQPTGATLAVFEGRPAPSDAGGTFTDVFPGLAVAGRTEVAADGSFLFANLLSGGNSGLFWLVPGCGQFTVALVGGAAPVGGTFLGFSPASGHTVADGVALFRAGLSGAGSGVFRQGP